MLPVPAWRPQRSLLLLAPRSDKAGLDADPSNTTLLYGVRGMEDLGWTLTWAKERPVIERHDWAMRVHRSLSNRSGGQLGFPVGFDLGESVSNRREARKADAVLAILENHVFPPAALRRLPGSPYGDRPLTALTCWMAERVLHLSPGRLRLLANLSRGVDRWFVFSRNQAPILADRLGIPEDRVRYVPFGVNLDSLAPAIDGAVEARRDPDSRALRVLSVGKDTGRDYATLFRAAKRIDASIQVACWERNLPVGLSRPTNIELVGHLPWPAFMRALARADVVVIPTHPFAYPTGQTVLLAAAATGCAVVTTDRPAIRDYVEDGVDGVLVPPADPDALSAAVTSLLADTNRRQAIGRQAALRVRGSFTEQHLWEAVDAELSELLE